MSKSLRNSTSPHQRNEAPASRGLIIAETLQAIVYGGLMGAVGVFALNLAVMLVRVDRL
ncbi:hypothetical protein [Arthrobacter psychrolactophilus]